MRENNKKRARLVLDALKKAGYSPECAIQDALSDLRHACDLKRLEYREEDRKAHANYTEEVAGHDDPPLIIKPRPLVAVVEVSGGVAHVTKQPKGVRVRIVDHD
jgi:hypothetical protein